MSDSESISDRELIIREAVMRANQVTAANFRVILDTLRSMDQQLRAITERTPVPFTGTLHEVFEEQKAARGRVTSPLVDIDPNFGKDVDPISGTILESGPYPFRTGLTFAEAFSRAEGRPIRRISWHPEVPPVYVLPSAIMRMKDAVATDWEIVP